MAFLRAPCLGAALLDGVVGVTLGIAWVLITTPLCFGLTLGNRFIPSEYDGGALGVTCGVLVAVAIIGIFEWMAAKGSQDKK
jgi:hypothetical protein